MKQLPENTVLLLSSTQVITSVVSIVKELVENALDGDATNVEVRLENFGLEKVEVQDNGTGIDYHDVEFVTKRHYTSKLSCFDDLQNLSTYGFRGEALNSLCSVAEVSIVTKTKNLSSGHSFKFDTKGQVLSESPCAACTGTTVTARNLFQNVPVRRQFYKTDRRRKKEIKELEDLLISYGIAYPDVRIVLFHNRCVIWTKTAVRTTRNALHEVWGSTRLNLMNNVQVKDESLKIEMECYFPKSVKDRNLTTQDGRTVSVLLVNKRPVVFKEFEKVIKGVVVAAGGSGASIQSQMCYYVSLTVPYSSIDVNVEPNKGKLFFHNKDKILDLFSKAIESICCTDLPTTVNVNGETHPEKHPASTPENDVLCTKNQEETATTHVSLNPETEIRPKATQRQLNICRNVTNNTSLSGTIHTDVMNKQKSEKAQSEKNMVETMDTGWSLGTLKGSSDNVIEPVRLLNTPAKRSWSEVDVEETLTEKNRVHEEKTMRSVKKKPPHFDTLAFIAFAREVRRSVMADNPTADYFRVSKIIRNMWEKLPDEKKDSYSVPKIVDSNNSRNVSEASRTLKSQKTVKSMIPNEVTVKEAFKFFDHRKTVKVKFCIDEVGHKLKKNVRENKKSFSVVGGLTNRLFICTKNNSLEVWDFVQVKKILIQHNLLNNYQVETKDLEGPLRLNERMLGMENWHFLMKLASEPGHPPCYRHIIDHRLVWNGIKLRKWIDDSTEEQKVELIALPDNLPFIVTVDLKTILQKLAANPLASLSDCRSPNVINYIQEESKRICKQLTKNPLVHEVYQAIQEVTHLPSNFYQSSLLWKNIYQL